MTSRNNELAKIIEQGRKINESFLDSPSLLNRSLDELYAHLAKLHQDRRVRL